MLNYEEVKTLLIRNLEQASESHDTGNYKKIRDQFDYVDGALPRIDNTEFTKFYIALNFWDSWIDASNHDWKYYHGIEKKDWPILAKRIISDLREDKEITDQRILEKFGPQNSKKYSLTKILLNLLKRTK